MAFGLCSTVTLIRELVGMSLMPEILGEAKLHAMCMSIQITHFVWYTGETAFKTFRLTICLRPTGFISICNQSHLQMPRLVTAENSFENFSAMHVEGILFYCSIIGQ